MKKETKSTDRLRIVAIITILLAFGAIFGAYVGTTDGVESNTPNQQEELKNEEAQDTDQSTGPVTADPVHLVPVSGDGVPDNIADGRQCYLVMVLDGEEKVVTDVNSLPVPIPLCREVAVHLILEQFKEAFEGLETE